MKTSYLVGLALGMLITPSLCEEPVPKWEIRLPACPAVEAAEPLSTAEHVVLTSRSEKMEVTTEPGVPDIPAVRKTVNVTVQLVEDPGLEAVKRPAQPPANAQEGQQDTRELFANRVQVFLSATVYNNSRTFVRLRVRAAGSNQEDLAQAWSNVNFSHFSALEKGYEVTGPDKITKKVSLMMMSGNADTTQLPQMPSLPDLGSGGPAFSLVDGTAEGPAAQVLEQLHELYRTRGSQIAADYQSRKAAEAAHSNELRNNPPEPPNVTLKFWVPNEPTNSISPEGGGQ